MSSPPSTSSASNAPSRYAADVSDARPLAGPFLKWAGGKRRLLGELLALLPPGVERLRYVEPFLGGGALFFRLAPARAFLADLNRDLVTTYVAVRDRVADVLEHLRRLADAHDDRAYYRARDLYNRGQHVDAAERAACFIYLNRTCYNGLHRVNRRGQFNVPVGRYAKPAILRCDVLLAASRALRTTEIRCASFERLPDYAGPGDFVYLDPPYVPISRTASFTGYTAGSFCAQSQAALREVFGELDRRGAKVLLSNSAVPAVRELYDGFRFDEVFASRSVSCKPSARGRVRELVIRNYGGDAREKTRRGDRTRASGG